MPAERDPHGGALGNRIVALSRGGGCLPVGRAGAARLGLICLGVVLGMSGCTRSAPVEAPVVEKEVAGSPAARETADPAPVTPATAPAVVTVEPTPKEATPAERVHPIVVAARGQIGRTVSYDPAYVRLDYPGGDVPIESGVCSDVVVRALREARGMDLQKLVHEDMKAAFSAYPKIWGLTRPDRHIDHRRVPNLGCYFKRKGYALPVSDKPGEYLPGDLVTCTVAGNRPHIMVVSERKNPGGVPLVIHNIGRGVREEDRLFEFPLTGHYRVKKGSEK